MQAMPAAPTSVDRPVRAMIASTAVMALVRLNRSSQLSIFCSSTTVFSLLSEHVVITRARVVLRQGGLRKNTFERTICSGEQRIVPCSATLRRL